MDVHKESITLAVLPDGAARRGFVFREGANWSRGHGAWLEQLVRDGSSSIGAVTLVPPETQSMLCRAYRHVRSPRNQSAVSPG